MENKMKKNIPLWNGSLKGSRKEVFPHVVGVC
jgi:hypothetical protein